MAKRKSLTNDTTRDILKHLFKAGVYAWRTNVLPVPMVRDGVFTGFRPGSKSGVSDILGILPARLCSSNYKFHGTTLCVEVKTGSDRLRPEQIGFLKTARDFGAITMVVKDFEDFLVQWNKLIE